MEDVLALRLTSHVLLLLILEIQGPETDPEVPEARSPVVAEADQIDRRDRVGQAEVVDPLVSGHANRDRVPDGQAEELKRIGQLIN